MPLSKLTKLFGFLAQRQFWQALLSYCFNRYVQFTMSHSFYEVADDFWQIITFANINSGVVVFKRHNSTAIPHADKAARSTDPIPRPQPLVCLNRNPFPEAVGHPFVFLDRKGFIAAERFCHSQLLFKLGNHLGAAFQTLLSCGLNAR